MSKQEQDKPVVYIDGKDVEEGLKLGLIKRKNGTSEIIKQSDLERIGTGPSGVPIFKRKPPVLS